MQLAHQFLLADISNAVPMPAGCQGRTRLVPDVAAPNKSVWSFASACFPSGEIPAFMPAMRGNVGEGCRIMRQSVWHSGP
jgi:hypothetical protein